VWIAAILLLFVSDALSNGFFFLWIWLAEAFFESGPCEKNNHQILNIHVCFSLSDFISIAITKKRIIA